eukprot:XP_012826909.1 PREDICTED: uncharacterized protein LOC100487625 [Xenopus tropicalis]
MSGLLTIAICYRTEIEAETHTWIKEILERQFNEIIEKAHSININEHNENISRCDVAILYHYEEENRIDLTKVNELLEDSKWEPLFAKFEKAQIIVVMDNVKDIKKKEVKKVVKAKAQKLLLFRNKHRSSINDGRSGNGKIKKKLDKLKKVLEEQKGKPKQKKTRVHFKKHLTVGICSRESSETYNWLVTLLKTDDFRNKVTDTRPVYVSNTFSQFRSDVSGCTFAILYHSKRRGRINVTDVTDSLYDQELEHLSQSLGRKKVIVVIDDLEDSSDSAKSSIQQSQGSIGRWACELFLFSARDKESLQSGSRPTDVELKINRLYSILSQAM